MPSLAVLTKKIKQMFDWACYNSAMLASIALKDHVRFLNGLIYWAYERAVLIGPTRGPSLIKIFRRSDLKDLIFKRLTWFLFSPLDSKDWVRTG
jgi:hypothetical protein